NNLLARVWFYAQLTCGSNFFGWTAPCGPLEALEVGSADNMISSAVGLAREQAVAAPTADRADIGRGVCLFLLTLIEDFGSLLGGQQFIRLRLFCSHAGNFYGEGLPGQGARIWQRLSGHARARRGGLLH